MSNTTFFARAICAAALATTLLPAQGKFTNFETPHTKPITTVTLQRGDFRRTVILVCNSADNSVEIYDAAPPHTFHQRVPVGMGPTTVRWNERQNAFFTCNFDGDTVSRVAMKLVPSAAGPVPTAMLTHTTIVGDQPSDISFDSSGQYGLVTLSGERGGTIIDALSMSLPPGSFPYTADEASLPAATPPIMVAPKAPRVSQLLRDGRFYSLNFQGGDLPVTGTAQVDVDLFVIDPANPTTAPFLGEQIGDMGTTNQSMAINSSGTQMFVVGTKALNQAAVGEAAVAALQFGFVESRLWVVDIPSGVTPTVRPEAPSGVLPAPTLRSRNLNRDYASLVPTAVGHARSLSQPSDIALIEGPHGRVKRIAITAFHSDVVTILTVDASVPGGYREDQIAIPVANPGGDYTTAGPSGIVYDRATNKLFVTCRLDSSLRVIDPMTNSLVSTISLNNDPTPVYIRSGRRFLYDAKFSSSSGFVSCASCHINAGTDGLRWDLSDPNVVAVPPQLEGTANGAQFGVWPANKGPLVTQTLQGLVNWETNAEGQYLLTNAPYHWRGDRAGFPDFNPAFVGLLGRATQLTDGEMFQYTRFINSVAHPPNPEQPIDRVVQGALGADPDDPSAATGAKLGVQVFHNFPTDGQQGCVGCHSLPEGSDNVFTEGFTLNGDAHPLETAAIRNLKAREVLHHVSFSITDPLIALSNAGLTHAGFFSGNGEHLSINFFCNSPVFSYPIGSPPQTRDTFVEAVTQYTRQFDWGHAPTAGLAYTLVPGDAFNFTAMNFLENQVAEANIGLAVITRSGSTYRGFYYDQSISPARYREEGTISLFTQAQIEAMSTLPDSSVILQATPLGNERRFADLAGVGTQLTGASPANIAAEPMAPQTYNTDIPLFDDNLRVDQTVSPPVVTATTQTSLWALRTFQISALGNFGVTDLHHEPPRRLRVTGDNIRPGAKLLFGIPTTTPGGFPVQVLELDLFPTAHTSGGRTIWETEEELDPMVTFAMLNGGPFAPDVVATAFRATTTPNLDPLTWNSFAWAVLNEDGSINSTVPFAPLTVQDTR